MIIIIIIITIVIISIVENPSKNFSFWVYYLNSHANPLCSRPFRALRNMTPHRLFVFQRQETFLNNSGTASLKIYRYIRTFFDNIA